MTLLTIARRLPGRGGRLAVSMASVNADLTSSLSTLARSLLPTLSLGALLGLAAGYALKTLGNWALLLLGLSFLLLQGLAWSGLIQINWLRLEAFSAPWLQEGGQKLWRYLSGVLTHDLPFGAAFTGGLLLGLRLRR